MQGKVGNPYVSKTKDSWRDECGRKPSWWQQRCGSGIGRSPLQVPWPSLGPVSLKRRNTPLRKDM